MPFGETNTSGDYARGLTEPGVTTGGLYTLNNHRDHRGIYIQPSGSDFTPGEVVMRVKNSTSTAINTLYLGSNLIAYNDEDRATVVTVEYSLDDVNFTYINNITTYQIADTSPSLNYYVLSDTINLSSPLMTGDYVYIRFLFEDGAGSGQRDEVGIDNIWITPLSNTFVFVNAVNDTASEASGIKFIHLNIANASSTDSTSVDVVLTGGTGSSADINSFTSETVTFPAGNISGSSVILTITDDLNVEDIETFELELQNVSGGSNAVIISPSKTTLSLFDDDNIVINEFLPGPQSDVNGDGISSSSDDEFIEIYNRGFYPVNFNGWTISDSGGVQFTFGNTILPPGEGLVVFGGGNPADTFPCQVIASSGLSLNNTGDDITLHNNNEDFIISTTYSSSSNDISRARNLDFTGSFADHTSIDGTNYSPGYENVNGAPLPLTWLSFFIIYQNNTAELVWKTTDHRNLDYFVVQTSIDGQHWMDIGRIREEETIARTEIHRFHFTDYLVKDGINYYRIKEVDTDGAYDYSEIRKVYVSSAVSETTLFPNPAHSTLYIATENGNSIESKVIFNSRGELVYRDISTDNVINISGLSPGIYFIKLVTEKGTSVQKFMKL